MLYSLLLLCMIPLVSSFAPLQFTSPLTTRGVAQGRGTLGSNHRIHLVFAQEDEEMPTKRTSKRRKRRKVADETPVQLEARDDQPVELVIGNVKDLVSGATPSRTDEPPDSSQPTTTSTTTTSSNSSTDNDALQQLLEDSKRMQQQEEERAKESEGSVSSIALKALSTLVTADFFFVCILLLWFLAGIFGQYVLKDETIQIAFNNIFEPVVQPALGLLMLGSAASAIIKEDDAEE